MAKKLIVQFEGTFICPDYFNVYVAETFLEQWLEEQKLDDLLDFVSFTLEKADE